MVDNALVYNDPLSDVHIEAYMLYESVEKFVSANAEKIVTAAEPAAEKSAPVAAEAVEAGKSRKRGRRDSSDAAGREEPPAKSRSKRGADADEQLVEDSLLAAALSKAMSKSSRIRGKAPAAATAVVEDRGGSKAKKEPAAKSRSGKRPKPDDAAAVEVVPSKGERSKKSKAKTPASAKAADAPLVQPTKKRKIKIGKNGFPDDDSQLERMKQWLVLEPDGSVRYR